MTTSVRDREDTLGEHLPALLRLTAALTGSATDAGRLAGQALGRVSSAELASGYPLLPLRQAVVRRFLQRSFRIVPVGVVGRLSRFELVVLALTHVERLTPVELATTVERPVSQVQAALASAGASLDRERPGGSATDQPSPPYDVAAALQERAAIEVEPTAVRREIVAARARSRRTRARTAVLSLLAVVVVALAVLAPGAIRARWPVDPRPADRWAQFVTVDRGSGWTVDERVVARTQESVTFVRAGQQCTVLVVDGDVVPAASGDERVVRVNGHPGVLSGRDVAPDVRWAYADGAAADLSCAVAGQVDDDSLLSLAAAIRFRPVPLALPFRLTAAPAPFVPAWVSVDPGPPATVAASYTATDARWSYVTVRVSLDPSATVAGGPSGSTVLPAGVTATTINGQPASLRQNRDNTGLPEICLLTPTGGVCLSAYWTSGDQTTRFQMNSDIGALLLDAAGHLELAPRLDDSDTWFDAQDVLR